MLLIRDNQQAIKISPGETLSIATQPNTAYRLANDPRADIASKATEAARTGDSLVISYADGTRILMDDYFLNCTAAIGCRLVLENQDLDALLSLSTEKNSLKDLLHPIAAENAFMLDPRINDSQSMQNIIDNNLLADTSKSIAANRLMLGSVLSPQYDENSYSQPSEQNIPFDIRAPSIEIKVSELLLGRAKTCEITFILSDSVDNFNLSYIDVIGGTLTNLQGSDTLFSATFTQSGSLTPSISIAANRFTDAAGNGNIGANSPDFSLDLTAPYVVIQATELFLAKDASSEITFTLSESLNDFNLSYIDVIGGTLTNIQGANTLFSATFTQSGSLTPSISIAADNFTDAAGNGNTLATSPVFTIDIQEPTLIISAVDNLISYQESTTITFLFSESVIHFSVGDITVTGGSLSYFSGSNASYTALFTQSGTDIPNILVPAFSVQDMAGTALLSTTQLAFSLDITPPSLSIDANNSIFSAGGSSTITFTFSKEVDDFNLTDVLVSGGNLSDFQGSGSIYTATFIQFGDTLPSIEVSAGVTYDLAGNANTASTGPLFSLDFQAPSLLISALKTDLLPSESTTITFNFSETVIDFLLADISIVGASLSNFSGSGNIYSATLTRSSDLSVVPSVWVDQDTTFDSAGNGNTLSTNPAFTTDLIIPSLLISAKQTLISHLESTLITFTFSEVVTGFSLSDINVSGGEVSNFSGSDHLYSATFTQDGSNTQPDVWVASGVAQDPSGNLNTAGTGPAFSLDISAPSLIISAADSLISAGEATLISFDFSESVSGFSVADINIAGGALSALSGSLSHYTALFTQSGTDIPSISVNAGVVQDSYGNLNETAQSPIFSLDISAPSLIISAADSLISAGDATLISFDFSEAITGFNVADVNVLGGTLSDFSGSLASYSAIFTQSENVTPDISVNAAVLLDIAGNANSAAVSPMFSLDTIAPSLSINITDNTLSPGETTGVTFTFTELPIDFTLADISTDNALISGLILTDDAKVYTAILTPTAKLQDFSNTVTVSANYTDAAGNTGSSATSANYVIDNNYVPIMTGAGDTFIYTEGDGAQIIDASLSLSDVDDSQLTSASIYIGSGFNNTEDLLSFASLGGITGSYNAATGVLSLSGNASISDYQSALQSVTYTNTNIVNLNPDAADRTIHWFINDDIHDSIIITSTINLQSVPQSSLATGTFNYTETIQVQSSEPGTAYLVHTSITVSNLSDITSAADNLWNQTTISTADTDTGMLAIGLMDGNYQLYTINNIGHLSIASTNSITLDSKPTVDSFTTTDTTPIVTGSADLTAGDTLTVQVGKVIYNDVAVSAGEWSIDTGSVNADVGAFGVIAGTLYFYAAGDSFNSSVKAVQQSVDLPEGFTSGDSIWLKIADGLLKGVKVIILETDTGITLQPIAAKYTTISEPDDSAAYIAAAEAFDFDINGNTYHLAQNAGNSGYGVSNVTYNASTPSIFVTPGTQTELITAMLSDQDNIGTYTESITFTLSGGFISNSFTQTIVIPSDFSLGDTLWLRTYENNTLKAVKIEITRASTGYNVTVLDSKYVSSPGIHFDPDDIYSYPYLDDAAGQNGLSQQVIATSASSDGYGITDFSIGNQSLSGFLIPNNTVTVPYPTLEVIATITDAANNTFTDTSSHEITINAINQAPLLFGGQQTITFDEDDSAIVVPNISADQLFTSDGTFLGLTTAVTLTIESFNHYGRIFEFTKTGSIFNSMILSNFKTTNQLLYTVYNNGVANWIKVANFFEVGVSVNIVINHASDGTVTIYKDGIAIDPNVYSVIIFNEGSFQTTLSLQNPDAGSFTQNYIGNTPQSVRPLDATINNIALASGTLSSDTIIAIADGDYTLLNQKASTVFNYGFDGSNALIDQSINQLDATPSSGTITYTTQSSFAVIGSATIINENMLVIDNGGIYLTSATIYIDAGFLRDEDLLSFTDTLNITGVYDAVNGILNLTGSASAAQYQEALRSVEYTNINFSTPSTVQRSINWTVNDGTSESATVISYIDVATSQEIMLSANDSNSSTGNIALTLNDSFNYVPLSPEQDTPNVIDASTDGFLSTETNNTDVSLSYDLASNFTQQDSSNAFVIDIYGTSSFSDRDNNFDILIYDQLNALIGSLDNLAIPDTSSHLRVNVTEFLAALTPGIIIGSFTIVGHDSDTDTSYNLFTIMEVRAAEFNLATPIILDLDGDGVETTSLEAGVTFDINGDGTLNSSAWVGANDALLVRDINGDGQINDASELFGGATTLADGSTASDGYAALADLDSNNDDVINVFDTLFNELQIWQDKNSDAIVQEGELTYLKDSNVAELNLLAADSNEWQHSNFIGKQSQWTDTSGDTHDMADVWLNYTALDEQTLNQLSVDFSIDSNRKALPFSEEVSLIEAAPSALLTQSSIQTTIGNTATIAIDTNSDDEALRSASIVL